MNIHELDSYNLGDAVKFNDKLNPRIWGADEKMRPEVREQLLKIADDFREFLGIDVDLSDITVSGSNAAYTYTPHSDIDLHLVVDLPKADANEVYRELFDAKKYAYNDMYNIQIGDYDVELYVQDANKKHVSQGIYSLKNNDWVSVPKRQRPGVDDISVRSKFEDLGHRIESAIKTGDYEKISDLAEKIKEYRQAGLDTHGEFGPENLAFKILRKQGLIKKLYDARNAAKDELLSLDERRKKKTKKKVRYGYSGYWYPGTAYAGQDHPAGTEGGDGGGDGGESVKEGLDEVSSTPDGVNPSTTMILSDVDKTPTDEEILKDFIHFVVKELKIEQMPRVSLRKDPQWPQVHKTFGRYNDEAKTLEVAWGQRHIMDVLRTVAHELTHKHQHEREGHRMGPDAGETGSPYENEANARAGVLMRDYGRLHPEYFSAGQADDLSGIEEQLDESLKTSAGTVAVLTCLLAGGSLSGCASAPQQNTQQILRTTQDVGRTVQTARNITRAGTEAEVQQEIRTLARVLGGRTEEANNSNILRIWKRLQGQPPVPPEPQAPEYGPADPVRRMPQNESASGYIPTKKQAKDPRFSMALTVDIKPGQVGKEANKLKLKTDRQGHPQIAQANGLFENLYKEYKKFKADEDYSPDKPPGPEFKPTMPAGTLRVDVSDVYDWYKLGQHISNMKGLGKHDFGKGPPSAIVSFGDEDTEHKFIDQIKATGLDVTDIDPADPKKRPGKAIKTDPTYNVDEAIQAPVAKNQDAEQYYKFIVGKARLGRPLTRAEQDYIKMYQVYRQQKLAEVKARYEMTDLDPWTFDQTPAGWRSLPSSARQADAIRQYIDTYVKNGQFVGAPEGAKTLRPYILYWHLGQVLTQMGRNGMAVSVMRQALDDGEAGWNAYVMATISFLRKDRRDFDHWAPLARGNEETIKRLTAGWGLPYKQAYAGQTLNEDEDLDEVKMSPSALEKFATSDAAKGIRAGFEAELIFRDTAGESEDLDPEPDYDADERAYSISQVIEFFDNDEYGYGLSDRERNRLEENLDETYMNWRDEQMTSDFRNDAEDLVREIHLDEVPLSERIIKVLTDGMEIDDAEADKILALGVDAPKFNSSSEQAAYAEQNPNYKIYLEALDDAEAILDEEVETSIEKQDGYYDQALDDYRDNYSGDDDSFFSDVGLRWMSDIANEYNLDWPVWNMSNGGNSGSRDWDEIGAELQQVVGMPVKVSSNYHSTPRKEGQWIIEPDGSLDPDDKSDEAGLEIVSPPMPLLMAIAKLKEVTDWANDPNGGNAYTNRSTGLHMGVSLPTRGGDVDYVKLILFMGDKYVLDTFGREANSFTASALGKLQQNIKGGKSDPAGVIKLLKHGLTELAYKELQKGVGTSKYTSAHLQNGYIEFRSPGGDWLAKADEEIGILENTMLRFARAMAIAGDPSADRQEYAKKLYKLVTADNEQYTDQLRLFSEFSAGTIDKEQLKKQWAEKTIGTERKTNQRWKLYDRATGEPVPGQEYNGYTEEEARARAKGKISPGSSDRDFDSAYELRNMSEEQRWEVYDVKTGKTLEIVQGRNKGEAADAVYDKYVDQGIGFNVRPYEDPSKLTPRAKLAKRITTKKIDYNYDIIDRRTVDLKVVDRFYATDDKSASETFDSWLKSKGLPSDEDAYGYRKGRHAADDQRDSVDLQRRLGVQDVDTDVAQNFEPRRQNYELVSDEDPDRVLHRMNNATADEVRAWIAQQEQGGMPSGFLRTRIVAESINPISGAGAVAPRPVIKKISTDKVDPVEPVIRSQKPRSAIGQAISQQDIENMTQQIQMARKLGDDVNENFADGKVKGKSRPGRVKRAGASCNGSVTDLRARAKRASGEKAKMYHWCANMKSGKKK
jgi:hypothetical protein